jgi:hypothetical protein
MDDMDPRLFLSTVVTIACWTIAGVFLGLFVVAVVSSADSRPAPGMCGNSVLEPGIGYGALLGFFGGCVAVSSRLPNS